MHSLFRNKLVSGRIAIATTDLDGNIIRPRTADAVHRNYNALRRFIKKHYANNLVCFHQDDPEDAIDAREFWLGPEAAKWLGSGKRRVLKQFADDLGVFAPRSQSQL